jgi:hypothetical protein
VNVYLRLWLTCPLLSASCCWSLYWLRISGVSLTFIQHHRICLFNVLLGVTTTVTNFPLSKHTGGGGATSAFSGWHVYLQFTWEMLLLPFHWYFPHTATSTSCLIPRLLGRWWHSCLLQPACLFTVLWGIALHLLFGSHGTPPSLLYFFCCCCCFVLSLFCSLFSLSGSQSVQGQCWSGTGLFVGVPHAALLTWWSASLELVQAGIWWFRSPPGFSTYYGVGMLCVGWGCGGVGILTLLGGFSCKVHLQHISKILL